MVGQFFFCFFHFFGIFVLYIFFSQRVKNRLGFNIFFWIFLYSYYYGFGINMSMKNDKYVSEVAPDYGTVVFNCGLGKFKIVS